MFFTSCKSTSNLLVMIATIEIPMKAISLNNYQKSARNGRRYTTAKGKDYADKLTYALGKHFRELREMSDTFDEKKHYFDVEYYFYFKDFYTKKEGNVSSKIPDCDNPIKVIQDALFNYMGLDDKFVFKVSGEKIASDKNHITIIVTRGLRGENIVSDLIQG